jgi:hypothetical protein
MKKSTLLASLGLAFSLALAGAATAGNDTPRLDRRENHQAGRIYDGVANGELTKREARRLGAGQVHLRRAEARAKADGSVTARERAHLQREANQQSRRIHRQKHDAQSRN